MEALHSRFAHSLFAGLVLVCDVYDTYIVFHMKVRMSLLLFCL